MALTKSDIQQIVTALEPRFSTIDSRFNNLESLIDTLARATKEQFDIVIADLDTVKDDVAVIKDIVKDHSFRITRLEHRVG